MRARTLVASLTSGALLMAGPAVATATAAPSPTVTVAASGLNSPRHLLATARGIYVAEAGSGGAVGASNCATGPSVTGTTTTQYCEGATGAIALITAHGTKVVDPGLPSVVEEDSGEVAGPSAVALGSFGRMAVTTQDELVNSDGTNGLTGAAAREFGTLRIGAFESIDIAGFASANPQTAATLGGLPGETTYDSDPFDVISYHGGFAVADAAANSLLWVGPLGGVRLLARFPTEAETAPAGVLGPNPVTIDAQAVPTSIAVGPDGALYVGVLRGVPSLPGTAQIYRVVPGQAPTVWASGLTTVTGIGFNSAGELFATEYNTGGLLSQAAGGALVEVSADGSTVTNVPVTGLVDPTGVAVASNGTVYVSNDGDSTAASSTPGEVLAISGLS